MSTPSSPFNVVNLYGSGCLRGVTVAMPTAQVQRLLPKGLELGPQTVTPPGTHPVILSFNSMFNAVMSVPTLLPELTYQEFTVGVPFTTLRPGPLGRAMGTMLGRGQNQPMGPYYYMPRLFLDSVLATLGGLVFWGFAKKLARFKLTEGRYAIDAENGAPQISLDWEAQGQPQPLAAYPHFNPVREMLDQSVISQMPAAFGPIFVLTQFNKDWSQAKLRPLRTSVRIDSEFLPGLSPGLIPMQGQTEGIDASVLGSYEVTAPWILGLPHAPFFER